MNFIKRTFSSINSGKRVTVIGANGGIGQPLSLLLKLDSSISHINLYDLVGAPGVAKDLSHINTSTSVKGFGLNVEQYNQINEKDSILNFQDKEFDKSLQGSDIVIIPAGIPRKPGMSRQDLFNVNASLMSDFANRISKNCPNALIAIISNPVNSLVPIFAETMKNNKCYNPNKIFGVTTLDMLRANTFISEVTGVDSSKINIPVIGGHSGESILPLLSQSKPYIKHMLNEEQVINITRRIQNAGTEVVLSKAGAGSATLSMAKAGAKFVNSLIKGLNGIDNVIECAYVESDIIPQCRWFSTKLKLGVNGIEKNYGLGQLDEFEKKQLNLAIKELEPSIKQALEFVKNNI